ncbi:MAG: hypothetical protein ACR2HC_05675 [Thermoleophilaceae bacterium]
MGFNFRDFDLATRFTWKFLRDATADQLRAVVNAALEADNRMILKGVMGCLFNPTARVNPESLTVFPLYNGDGAVPPDYAGQSFVGSTHTHYLASGAAVVDGGDLVELIDHVTHHGYADTGRLLLFVNSTEGKKIRGFRVASGAPFDFIRANPPRRTSLTRRWSAASPPPSTAASPSRARTGQRGSPSTR